jgi:hypothetical protein
MHVKELVIPEHIESASAKQVLEWSLETFQPCGSVDHDI